jgi:hypothetical protein
MDYTAARAGGYSAILDEALPSVAASAAIFNNAPATTRKVLLTVRGGTLSVRLSGTAATAANGHDYPSGTYEFTVNSDEAKRVRAIQSSGSVTGYITYLGMA